MKRFLIGLAAFLFCYAVVLGLIALGVYVLLETPA